ncbi:glycosyltransferase [Parasphingopyxis sp.]|uniref:glycosyltransferase n=1 Tax=Parasphingopyxis sp. TaxID=1920299 RepID=UPI002629932B|nr:glycosyltransferase [Parasphingopyxis sp.]
MRDGKFFFASPADWNGDNPIAEGMGETRKLSNTGELLQSVNLIEDPAFRDGDTHWRTSFQGFENVATSPAAEKDSVVAPTSGRALKSVITVGKDARQGRLFLIYADPVWGKNIPVTAGEKCQLSCRCQIDGPLRNKPASVKVALEFRDANDAIIGAEAHEFATVPGEDANGFVEAVSVQAVAPPGAQYMLFVIRLSIEAVDTDHGEIEFRIAEPTLMRGTEFLDPEWSVDPVDLDPIRRFIADPNRPVYVADTSLRAMDRPLSKIILRDDQNAAPLLEYDVPKPKGSPVAQVFAIETPTLKIKVRQFFGTIAVRIDGETIGTKSVRSFEGFRTFLFTMPTHYLDDNYHVIEVSDYKTGKVMARDCSIIADNATPWSAIETYCMPPFERRISPRANQWMRAYESQLEYFAKLDRLSTQDKWLMQSLPRIRDVITRGFENNTDFFPLEFQQPKEPLVSVIIPVHGKYSVTFHCLCSLLLARNNVEFELIVVNDGSPDDTAERLAEHKGITVVSREAAGGFIDACHDGADHASGEYLLFLNNDVETTAGWIDELVKVFEIFPGTGAAASKLLFPDGRLQDAGGIVWNTGTPANYGRGKNALDPRFTYSRDADYLSGAALMTPVEVWNEIGGFEDSLRPAYFEDTWYSFAVRELGLRTIYCAPSKVYHVQGVSNGVDTDTNTGLKRFQKINHPKFKQRWAKAYAAHGDEWDREDLQKDRTASGRALVISWTLARPDHDAGSFALLQEMRMLQSLGMKVTHLPGNCAYMGRYNEDLYRQGIECIHAPFASSVEDFLIQRGSEFDMVYVCNYTTLEPLIDPIRKYAPQAKLVLNIMDLHFLREMRKSLFAGDAEAEENAHRVRDAELAVIKRTDMALSYSDLEVEMMRALVGSAAKVKLLPWVQETNPGDATFKERSGLCFVGSYRHPPNVDAVHYFAESIVPILHEPDAKNRLHVYGSGWDKEAQALSQEGVDIEGFIEDIADAYAHHRIFASPLTSGAGIKGKVISAMAHGIPTILSNVSAEGMALRHMDHCLIANSPQEWVEAIELLQTDEQLWQKIRDNALEFVDANFSFERGSKEMRDIVSAVDIYV